MSRRGLRWNAASPDGAAPCFCPSCMQLGGAARAAMRAQVFAETRAIVARAPDDPLPPETVIARRRAYQRIYSATEGRGAKRAAAKRARAAAGGAR